MRGLRKLVEIKYTFQLQFICWSLLCGGCQTSISKTRVTFCSSVLETLIHISRAVFSSLIFMQLYCVIIASMLFYSCHTIPMFVTYTIDIILIKCYKLFWFNSITLTTCFKYNYQKFQGITFNLFFLIDLSSKDTTRKLNWCNDHCDFHIQFFIWIIND